MGIFYGRRPTNYSNRRKSIDIKRLILQSFSKKRQTISEISNRTEVSWHGISHNLEELKQLKFVEETITTPTTRIFKLTKIGEDFVSEPK
ncbi:MAG: hypothetical protein KAK00_07105 [Nanoarchaeota archaeon]|nr:hypothetical protein [Nanoarchaeota archaeon]